MLEIICLGLKFHPTIWSKYSSNMILEDFSASLEMHMQWDSFCLNKNLLADEMLFGYSPFCGNCLSGSAFRNCSSIKIINVAASTFLPNRLRDRYPSLKQRATLLFALLVVKSRILRTYGEWKQQLRGMSSILASQYGSRKPDPHATDQQYNERPCIQITSKIDTFSFRPDPINNASRITHGSCLMQFPLKFRGTHERANWHQSSVLPDSGQAISKTTLPIDMTGRSNKKQIPVNFYAVMKLITIGPFGIICSGDTPVKMVVPFQLLEVWKTSYCRHERVLWK